MSWASPRSPDQVNTNRHCLLTLLPCQISSQLFKMIARGRSQVEITGRVIDYLQLSEQSVFDFRGYLLAGFIFQIKIPEPAVPETLNQ
jgi:hypothetical protein